MTPKLLRPALVACVLMSIAVPTVALADPGIMVHSTVTIKISGAPIQMPPRTITKDQCAPAHHSDVRRLVTQNSHNQNCTFPTYKDDGNTISFHMACAGNPQIEDDGTFTYKSDGSVNGTTHGEGNMGGQKMTIDTTYAQTPTGATCEYTPHDSAASHAP